MMSDEAKNRTPAPHKSSWHQVVAGVWAAISVGALALLALVTWLFEPTKGLLPSPTWLVDPVAGWVLGTVIGIACWRLLMRLTPWALCALALVFVAVMPALFVKYPAMSAFCSGFVIGVAGGALFWRARTNQPGPLI